MLFCRALFVFALGTQARRLIQNAFADAQAFGRNLQKLIIGQEFQTGLQAHLLGRGQAQRVVAAGSAHIGQLFALADVYDDILHLWALAYYHALVHRGAGLNKQRAALLGVV